MKKKTNKGWKAIVQEGNFEEKDITAENLKNYLREIFFNRLPPKERESTMIKDLPCINVAIWKEEDQWYESYQITGHPMLHTGRGGFEYYWSLLPELSRIMHQFTLNGETISKEKLFEIIQFKEKPFKIKEDE